MARPLDRQRPREVLQRRRGRPRRAGRRPGPGATSTSLPRASRSIHAGVRDGAGRRPGAVGGGAQRRELVLARGPRRVEDAPASTTRTSTGPAATAAASVACSSARSASSGRISAPSAVSASASTGRTGPATAIGRAVEQAGAQELQDVVGHGRATLVHAPTQLPSRRAVVGRVRRLLPLRPRSACCPPSIAEARVVVVASGDGTRPSPTSSRTRSSRGSRVGGRHDRAVAVAPDGSRAYVATGSARRRDRPRRPAGRRRGRAGLRRSARSAITPDGARLYAARSRRGRRRRHRRAARRRLDHHRRRAGRAAGGQPGRRPRRGRAPRPLARRDCSTSSASRLVGASAAARGDRRRLARVHGVRRQPRRQARRVRTA